jgi:hypothetical protein
MSKLPLPNVETVDLETGTVTIEGGQVLPIVQYRDEDGRLCSPDEATGVLAGTLEYGWIGIDLMPEPATVH